MPPKQVISDFPDIFQHQCVGKEQDTTYYSAAAGQESQEGSGEHRNLQHLASVNHSSNFSTNHHDATSAYVVIANRSNCFSAHTWWLVDLSLDPPPEQGASHLVKNCMNAFLWDETFAKRVLSGYRQFLYIATQANDWTGTILAPPHLIDQMWSQHALDLIGYCHDCMLLCGHVLARNVRGYPSEDIFQQRQTETYQRLEAAFGKDYDTEVWSYETVTGSVFSIPHEEYHDELQLMSPKRQFTELAEISIPTEEEEEDAAKNLFDDASDENETGSGYYSAHEDEMDLVATFPFGTTCMDDNYDPTSIRSSEVINGNEKEAEQERSMGKKDTNGDSTIKEGGKRNKQTKSDQNDIICREPMKHQSRLSKNLLDKDGKQRNSKTTDTTSTPPMKNNKHKKIAGKTSSRKHVTKNIAKQRLRYKSLLHIPSLSANRNRAVRDRP